MNIILNSRIPYYKCVVALSMLYVTMYIASYPVVYKIVKLGPVIETGAIFLFPMCYAISDIVAEVYGYRIARQMVWLSMVCGLVFCGAIIGIINMPSPAFWNKENSYIDVLQPMYKSFIAMTVATIVGSFINIYIISKWRVILNGKFFWLRSIVSSSFGELAFSIIAGLIAFFGVEPTNKLIWLIFNGWALKVLYAAFMSGPATILVKLIRSIEGIDPYTKTIKFNPFKIGVDVD